MYSTTDPSLPFGESTESVGTYRQPTYKKRSNVFPTEQDMYRIQQRVKRVYRDQILN
jgi:hypothetical protein